MRRMYEFACENGHRIEKLVSYEMAQVQCECGGKADRIVSAPAFRLEGWSGSFPTAAAQFDRRHREKLAAEQKANR
jgi:putative FmdB family regulatory protein